MPNYIYENDTYGIALTKFTDPVLGEEVTGYGIFNKNTKVREAETRRMNTAIAFATQFFNEEVARAQRELEEEQKNKEFPIQ